MEQENYDEAKRLKTIIDGLTEIQDEVERLEMEKLLAVQEERYDDAKSAKLQVERLLASALRPAQQSYGGGLMPPSRSEAMTLS